MARDTAAIGENVVIGSGTPPVESTVEALIRSYNRQPLDTDLSSGDLVYWNGTAWVRVTGTPANGQIPVSDGAGGVAWGNGASELLAVTAYAAAADSAYNISGTAFADVDATNLAVTFTAPASGKVLIRLSSAARVGTRGNIGSWNLREGTADVAGTAGQVISDTPTRERLTHTTVVSGLTAGTSYTYKWGAKVDTGSTTIDHGPNYGKAVMEVWSAPA